MHNSAGMFTDETITNFSACYWNTCTLLDKTTSSTGSYINTSFMNISGLLDAMNVSLGTFANVIFLNLSPGYCKQMFQLEVSQVRVLCNFGKLFKWNGSGTH